MVAMHWEKYMQHILEKYNSIYKQELPKITPHVLRHTFCSRMANSGMNPKTLQYIMGHSDISVTFNTYTHNITPKQYSGDIQVISANLRQDFKFGPVHLDNEVTYQHTSHSAPLPLPTLTLFSNLYLEFKIAKVLNCQIGGDVRYFTEYTAPAYSPVMGQYMTQNSNNKIKIGNYPILSAYANFDLKRTRFYVEYYHANQSDGRYFWAPGYPVNPSCLRMGISWNFYD